MPFHADLHVHSKYSRATSRDLDLEHLALWAARKGVAVVGTGDCIHPAWLAELKDKLVPTGDGLFRLKKEIEQQVFASLPASCRALVRFMLSTEISTIYKKGERTRKIHHLIYADGVAAADRLAASLARIGNIASDGRPILGIDSRNLLEIALASGPASYLVPAHIWTPWFAALGSQSGFDSIEECYGDLSQHIFAVETGLSSDPAMNWRVSSLDRFRLTSNSDAHSPGKLGREATRFSCEPDYFAIRRALETGDGYVGTVEFFPEEGKYHLDGHRACGVRLEPAETIALGGLCPACGGRVTVGVAHRVETLADRGREEAAPPPTAGDVRSLTPLPEILSELLESGVASQGVSRAYDRVTAALGPELSILEEAPIEDVARTDPLLGEAVARLRKGVVIRQAGYDGEYGAIRLFDAAELSGHTKGGLLFDAPAQRRARRAASTNAAPKREPVEAGTPARARLAAPAGALAGLDVDQRRAAEAVEGVAIVLAGPGAGKTRVLTRRLAHLVLERGAPAPSCLAVTFTRRATAELKERLSALIPRKAGECVVHSFHSLGLAILRAEAAAIGLTPGFLVADERQRASALAREMQIPESRASRLVRALSLLKRTEAQPQGEAVEALAASRRIDRERNWIDFDDLIGFSVELLETNGAAASRWRGRFRHICVDEFQDVDERQYKLIRLLAAGLTSLCVIGDPNQAIYGFRGADDQCFRRLMRDFPAARVLRLSRNYRSSGAIVGAGAKLIGAERASVAQRPTEAPIALQTAADERAEAEFVAAAIEEMLGGHDLIAANRDKSKKDAARPLGFADFAILYRTDAQSPPLRQALDAAGIPYKKSSPAPISAQPAVRALLRALAQQGSEARLAARIEAAGEQVRREEVDIDLSKLAEAKRWVAALADAGDEAHLCEQVALSTEADFWDPRADRVSLLTMHAAKGLEFAVVFIVGVEDGLTPFSWDGCQSNAQRDENELRDRDGEERRLFYVAMTRAKDRLFLSRALQRSWRGKVRCFAPSRYLQDIPPGLISQESPRKRNGRAAPRQYTLF